MKACTSAPTATLKLTEVDFGNDTVTVTVRRQRRKLAWPARGFTTWAGYDFPLGASSWKRGGATQPE